MPFTNAALLQPNIAAINRPPAQIPRNGLTKSTNVVNMSHARSFGPSAKIPVAKMSLAHPAGHSFPAGFKTMAPSIRPRGTAIQASAAAIRFDPSSIPSSGKTGSALPEPFIKSLVDNTNGLMTKISNVISSAKVKPPQSPAFMMNRLDAKLSTSNGNMQTASWLLRDQTMPGPIIAEPPVKIPVPTPPPLKTQEDSYDTKV